MALPIKITPVLKGEDPRKFNERVIVKVPEVEKKRIKELVAKVISNKGK